jgi:hypothetical protein
MSILSGLCFLEGDLNAGRECGRRGQKEEVEYNIWYLVEVEINIWYCIAKYNGISERGHVRT